ncbi:magnesium transporter MRS2-B-like [Dioscorea cayenensis subsp. rotundata]|uniref:Magnesium transporter MRS2-B-like n=1 Tax=Dioscorea cayennensis subsp. rotundata TaxID=55577 RepID=A0AB40AXY9_DIOCR|nr:magnesium transporter MRS2-B-like [Dioscorea cayenensis subsp. rotundata]
MGQSNVDTYEVVDKHINPVKDEIEQLINDDGDMAEMYLTEKKRRMESSFYYEQYLNGYGSIGGALSVSDSVSPISIRLESRRLEKIFNLSKRWHESMKSSDINTKNIEELKMLVEAYFVVIDSSLNKLTSLKEYIDDIEDFINIHQLCLIIPIDILIFCWQAGSVLGIHGMGDHSMAGMKLRHGAKMDAQHGCRDGTFQSGMVVL